MSWRHIILGPFLEELQPFLRKIDPTYHRPFLHLLGLCSLINCRFWSSVVRWLFVFTLSVVGSFVVSRRPWLFTIVSLFLLLFDNNCSLTIGC